MYLQFCKPKWKMPSDKEKSVHSNTINKLCEGYGIFEETGSEFPLYWIEQLQLLQPGI